MKISILIYSFLAALPLLAIAQSTTIPVPAGTGTVTITFNPAVTPPTCGALPAPVTQNAQCPAGTTGTYTQTATYTAAAYPTCKVLGPFSPTTPPAGACTAVPPITANCGNVLGGPVTFCYTFDTAMNVAGTRTGALDPNVWGVSRTTGNVNLGQGQLNMWNATTIVNCDGTTPTVVAPADVIICNGQLREASNDNNTLQSEDGTVISLAMYPKQPFDFAGRTGTISFDVSNDSSGIHGAWPEVWLSDTPDPDPFSHFSSWLAIPANGFGVVLSNEVSPGMQGECPNANNLSHYRWTVLSAIIARGYVEEDTAGYGVSTGTKVNLLDCVISSSGPGNMNHVELRVSQNQIDVYATDAGVAATPATLRKIASITGANLTTTRGLVWLEDAHYNADKGDPTLPTQRQHTFSWDNLAFDGPFTQRDFSYDAPDQTKPGSNGAINTGQLSQPNGTTTWTVTAVPANPQAAAAKVLFNMFVGGAGPNPTVINVAVNGNKTTVPWPYPDSLGFTWRTLAVQVPLSALVPGTNTVQLGGDQALVFANIDIVLGDVTGGVPVLPGANNGYP